MAYKNLEQELNESEKWLVEGLEELANSMIIPVNISGYHTIKSGTYDVDHDIIVNVDGRLCIEEGTTLNFKVGKGLYIGKLLEDGGQLCIYGTKSNPVVLQAKTSTWKGLSLIHTNKNNVINFTTIKNARKQYGGGIFTKNSTLLIVDSTIKQCKATSRGGGMYNLESDVYLDNSIVEENSANHHGGGIYTQESIIRVDNTDIIQNIANFRGGGIYNIESELKMENSNVTENTSMEDGAGMYNDESNIRINKSNITKNSSHMSGGGIYNHKSFLSIGKSNITKNNAEWYGGGMYNDESTLIEHYSNDISNNLPDNIREN